MEWIRSKLSEVGLLLVLIPAIMSFLLKYYLPVIQSLPQRLSHVQW